MPNLALASFSTNTNRSAQNSDRDIVQECVNWVFLSINTSVELGILLPDTVVMAGEPV